MAALTLKKLTSPFSHLNSSVFVPFRCHVGYMPFEGPLVPKNSPRDLLFEELKKVNLKPVTRLHFKWDPLHPRARSARHILHSLSAERIRASNPKCAYKTDVLTDRSEATLKVSLEDGRSIFFKLAYLECLDVVSILNKHVLPMVKEEKQTVLESKGAKMAAGKKKK